MGATALINHSRALSTSEVGLNFGRRAAQGLWSRLVPPTGTKGGHAYRFVAPTGTNAPPLVPVGATNRDQRSLFSSLKGGNRRPLVPVGGTNRD